jgi:hypothetical protein
MSKRQSYNFYLRGLEFKKVFKVFVSNDEGDQCIMHRQDEDDGRSSKLQTSSRPISARAESHRQRQLKLMFGKFDNRRR